MQYPCSYGCRDISQAVHYAGHIVFFNIHYNIAYITVSLQVLRGNIDLFVKKQLVNT